MKKNQIIDLIVKEVKATTETKEQFIDSLFGSCIRVGIQPRKARAIAEKIHEGDKKNVNSRLSKEKLYDIIDDMEIFNGFQFGGC
ncbi:hypothetical protein [Bacillus sp. COPE52]|uniref:hypothetical protein n=1 Tax=Bacillus sp. COPE52 TaxID=2233998 RepID=UPI000E10CFFA|nr:hypothetical protein [Bacillus sp. COPE52]AXK19148.1 hypothetical protein DPQ31_16190 [Bacillus sp. COPE52]